MKNLNKIPVLVFVLLLLTIQSLSSQNMRAGNSFALWTSAGYSSINNHLSSTEAAGGIGASIGGGYEFYWKSGFMLQAGLEMSYYNFSMNHGDTLQIVNMLDTEAVPFRGHFYFENIKEQHKMMNFGPSLMLGYKSLSGFYFLAGGKVMLNISAKSETLSDVTSKGQYDNLIGDNDDGMLSGMLNHDLFTERRSKDKSLKINPFLIGSVEAGYVISPPNIKNNKPEVRLAAFCDYGFSAVPNKETNYDLIINGASDGRYRPQIDSFLFHNVESQFLNTLFAGVKLTVSFGIPQKYDCKCNW